MKAIQVATSSVRTAKPTRLRMKTTMGSLLEIRGAGRQETSGTRDQVRSGCGLERGEDRERLGAREGRLGQLGRIVRPRSQLLEERDEPSGVDDRAVEILQSCGEG